MDRHKEGLEPLEVEVEEDPRRQIEEQPGPSNPRKRNGKKRKFEETVRPGNVSPRSAEVPQIKLERIEESDEEQESAGAISNEQQSGIGMLSGRLDDGDQEDEVDDLEMELHHIPNWPGLVHDGIVTKNFSGSLADTTVDLFEVLSSNPGLSPEILARLDGCVLSTEEFVDCFNFMFDGGMKEFMNT